GTRPRAGPGESRPQARALGGRGAVAPHRPRRSGRSRARAPAALPRRPDRAAARRAPRPAPQPCAQALARARGGAVGRKVERGVMTRDEALALMHEQTQAPSLHQHMLAVEAAMRAYAAKYGEDPEPWGIVGLLHDFDYERYPNDVHSPTEEHPSWGVRLLRGKGLPESLCRANLGHARYSGVPGDTHVAKVVVNCAVHCGTGVGSPRV